VTSYADRKNLYFKPTIVGLHGDQGVTVDKKDLNYWESLQAAVYPASLFEVYIILYDKGATGACSHRACTVAPRSQQMSTQIMLITWWGLSHAG
jgi:hypothetical protein